jgi:PST family polysaccharide transporter
MHKTIIKSVSYLYLLQAVNQLLPLIIVPYLLRTIGLSEFGKIQIATAFAGIGVQITDWGFNFSGSHSVAKLKGNSELLSSFIVNSIAAKCVLFCVWTVLSVVAYIYYSNISSPAYYFITLLMVLSSAFAPQWIYQGLEKFAEASITSTLIRFASTGLIFVFVKTPDDAINTLILNVVAGTTISLLLWIRLPNLKQLRLSTVAWPAIKRVIVDGSAVFVTTIMIAWYTTGALIVVGLIGGAEAAGIYAISEKIVSACKVAMNPVVQVLYVRISSIQKLSKAEFYSVTKLYFVLLFLCFLLGLFLLLLLKDFIFNLMFHVPGSRASAVLIPLAIPGLSRFWIIFQQGARNR